MTQRGIAEKTRNRVELVILAVSADFLTGAIVIALTSGEAPLADPPHDASGHTWHHPDSALFGMTKFGPVPGKYAPPGYRSDMSAFSGMLTDEEIRAVLAFIKTAWPERIRRAQAETTRNAPGR